jgi:linoleoyl-CoA desaturase
LTTTNYAPKSRIFSWYVGGLNFQIEHHLFPNICHVHYKRIAGIVAETAREYGLPYNSQKNFLNAIKEHGRMLYMLGRDGFPQGEMAPVRVKSQDHVPFH